MKNLLNALILSAFLSSVSFSAEVKMKSLGYDPKVVEIIQGESVTWKNTAYTEHSATSDDGKFDTGLIAPQKERSVTFKDAGKFKYHCAIHGKTMTGTVVVGPAGLK
jgi:plastocyanin